MAALGTPLAIFLGGRPQYTYERARGAIRATSGRATTRATVGRAQVRENTGRATIKDKP